ncbi:MAG: hypothetical protein ACJ789_06515 [Thermomicrobiales bacterium]
MVQRRCSSDGQSQSGSEAGVIPDSLAESGETAVEICSTGTEEDSYRAPTLFAWQSGRQVLLLDEELGGHWQMAELEYDPILNRYVEVRRATYDWFREALGALMSRALLSGEAVAEDAGTNLLAWYFAYYAPILATEPH